MAPQEPTNGTGIPADVPPDDIRSPDQEELFESLLIAYDEALARGEAKPLDERLVPPELLPRLRAALDCLSQLAQARRLNSAPPEKEHPPDASSATKPLGKIARFQLLRELGRGGHGVVFLAIDPRLGRLVALKVPRAETLATPEVHRRFLREAQAASSLTHPNLVPIYEAGDDGPICYLAAGYCRGPSLAEWLRQQRSLLPFQGAVALLVVLADAVAHAHERGIIHRDIKPANVLLEPAAAGTPGGASLKGEFVRPCLTDFGLARLDVNPPSDATANGVMMGTPAYMSPEQAEGRTADIGPATDVYAIGAIFYELLVGHVPFRGSNDLETLRMVSAAEFVNPSALRPGVPLDLEAICMRALARQPSDRYRDAAALTRDLQRFLRGEPTEARPLGHLGRAGRWIRRRPLGAALVAVVAAALLTFAVGGWWHSVRLGAALTETRRVREHVDDLLYSAELRGAWQAFNSDNAPEAKAILERMEGEIAQRADGADPRSFAWRLLRKLTQQDVLTIAGHEGDVYSVAFSPDGRRLASASQDGTVRVWDAAAGRPIALLTGHAGEVNAVVWSGDGRWLVSAGDDGTVRLWHADSLTAREPALRRENVPVVSLAFSADGELLASGDDRGVIVLARTSDWQVFKTITADGGRTHGLAFSHDGNWLAAATDQAGVIVWRLDGTVPTQSTELQGNRSRGVVFDRAGRLASCGMRWACVWDIPHKQFPRRFGSTYDYFNSIALCADERFAALAAMDEMLRVVDISTGELREALIGHTDRIWSVAASPDGRRLATGSSDDTIRIWQAPGSPSELIIDCAVPLQGIGFTSDGNSILEADVDGVLRRRVLARAKSSGGGSWGVSAAKQVSSPPSGLEPPRRAFRHLDVCAAACLGATYRRDALGVQLWNPSTGEAVGELIAAESSDPTPRDAQTSAIALTADGRLLAEAVGSSVRIWEVSSQSVVRHLAPAPVTVSALAFSSDARHLAIAAGEWLELRDLSDDGPITRWQAHRSRINAIAFSSAGLLGTAGRDRLVKLWDATSGRIVASFHGHAEFVDTLSFSPDGLLLASGGGDHVVKIWSLRTYDELATLRGFPGTIAAVAFHPTRMILAAGGYAPDGRGQLRLWCAGADDRWQRPAENMKAGVKPPSVGTGPPPLGR